MNTIHTTPRRTGNAAWSQRGICLSLLAVLWLSAAPAIADGPPDFSIGADRFPGADAVILNWQQTWTLDEDGAVRRRDHKWIKLFNSRPIRNLKVDFASDIRWSPGNHRRRHCPPRLGSTFSPSPPRLRSA